MSQGNKRTALAACLLLLALTGYQLTATQAERAAWILELSAGGTVEQLADRIRDALIPAR